MPLPNWRAVWQHLPPPQKSVRRSGVVRMLDRTDRSLVGVWWWTVDRWLLASTILLMVIGTTFLAPVLLRLVIGGNKPDDDDKVDGEVAADPVGLI